MVVLHVADIVQYYTHMSQYWVLYSNGIGQFVNTAVATQSLYNAYKKMLLT